MGGSTSPNLLGATATNPYGITPSQQAWMSALGSLGKGVDAAITPPSANYMRQNAAASFNPGQSNAGTLLDTLIQMRQAGTNRLADPYQAGLAMPSTGPLTSTMSLLR
jgi:hypothetical protein